LMKSMGPTGFTRENTTLVVVATNAVLTKLEATKLAQMGQLGMARAISPVNTMSDGDLVVAMSAAPPGGSTRAPIDALGVAAAEAVAQAILRAVRMSPSLGGLPGSKK
jgi:L-aminopeptidase/D-esterase-like protein